MAYIPVVTDCLAPDHNHPTCTSDQEKAIGESGVFDASVEARVRDSIARQSMLTTLGIRADVVRAGHVELSLKHREDLCQQHGFLHAGAITTIADSAAGYAALTLAPPDRDVLTVSIATNLLAPAVQPRFVATGTVVRAGRTLTVVTAQVRGIAADGSTTVVAIMQATIMAVTLMSQ
ncbi:PaaI family thioesterase [Streptomyces sp. RKAG293]|uniref:PaaI family thioesterase n=1 Tax=Streptomyces sp. RKAG293 TaxID=2893403 RepID=UPI0020334006|nr:PaaI family thioesterase [Streptomyces sp. RKAG293]MCM2416575.1 PaaI family thioesterase [Streptomyces sp. RKAG293]